MATSKKTATPPLAHQQRREGSTPEETRAEFLSRAKRVGSVTVEPLSLGILWLLEDIGHAFSRGGECGMTGTFQAIYIFNDSEAAYKALAEGQAAFNRAVRRFIARIPPNAIPAIMIAMREVILAYRAQPKVFADIA